MIKKYITSTINKIINEKLKQRLLKKENRICNDLAQPNGNESLTYDYYMSNNIKNIMSFFAEQRISEIENVPLDFVPSKQNMTSKISTQSDMEEAWCRHWLRELKIPFRYHRKLWEFSFVLQVLFEHGMFGKPGLGLACGVEVLPSYLISKGCKITAGDKPLTENDSEQEEWISGNQYTQSKDSLYHAQIVDKAIFDKNFTLTYADMNALPSALYKNFDFCWSICAIEHLGSIRAGCDFLINSLKVLQKGGISVHTTEFNLFSNENTIDNWGSVLFTKKHLTSLEQEVARAGGKLYPFNFDTGNGFFDRYIDMPPHPHQSVIGIDSRLPPMNSCPHIKLLSDGFPATCAGVIIQKISDRSD